MKPNTWSVVGWILGAFSFLNLIKDVKYIEIQGKLADWLATYSVLAKKMHSILFSWINFNWMKIKYVETHFFVIVVIFVSALVRIEDIEPLKKVGIVFGCALLCIVLLALFPDIVSFLLFGLMPMKLLINENNEFFKENQQHIQFLMDLAGVFGVALVLLAMSKIFE